MWLDTDSLATLPETVLETFADAAHEHARESLPACARAAGLIVKRATGKRAGKYAGDWTHGAFAQHRPDGLLERVGEALVEQEIWTASAMCARLGLPATRSELISVGSAIAACGWHKRTGSVRGAGRWEYRAQAHSDQGTVEALIAADHRRVWTTDELVEATGVNVRHVGRIMIRLGWRRRRRDVQGKLWTEYLRQ